MDTYTIFATDRFSNRKLYQTFDVRYGIAALPAGVWVAAFGVWTPDGLKETIIDSLVAEDPAFRELLYAAREVIREG